MATRILIADDHEMMRTVLRNLLNSHDGWQVCAEAKNGSEAVVQTRELHPDVVVLDLAMPVMDGMRAAREITRNTPELPVIMFTLHASPEVEEQAKRVGVRYVVSKARNAGRLVTAIERTLGGDVRATDLLDLDNVPPARLKENRGKDAREIRVHQVGAGLDTTATPGATSAQPSARANAAGTSASRNSSGETGALKNPSGRAPSEKE
jgi:DNA-binding NarL/FixJ family response regulator